MQKLLILLTAIFFFVIGLSVVTGGRAAQVYFQQQPTFSPQPVVSESEPPAQSLVGMVVKLEGEAKQAVRRQDESVAVATNSAVLEAEAITTSAMGQVEVRFPEAVMVSLGPDSVTSFPSTNPARFLLKHDRGVVVFQTDTRTDKIAVRSLHGLFELNQGSAQLTTDPNQKLITFTLIQGTGRVGYIDSENQTQMVEISAGQTLVFDDLARTTIIQ